MQLEYFNIAVELIANGKVNEAYTGVKLILNILNIAIYISAVINNPNGKRKLIITGLGLLKATKYPAKQRLGGAAIIANVGNLVSSILSTKIILQR